MIQAQDGEAAPPDHAGDLYDRGPPRRVQTSLAPFLVLGLGVIALGWAVAMALQPAPGPALAAPPEAVEFTTGVAPDAAPPPPRAANPPPPPEAAPIEAWAPAEDADAAAAAREAQAREAEARRQAPMLVYRADPARAGAAPEPAAPVAAPARPVRASIGLAHALLEGALIAATLETAVQSDLPGPIRAVVARDVYSADASRVLLPRGSRLIGSYRSGLVAGQSRVFAVWSRIIRPDGASVTLEAPLVDGQGRAGADGRRDTHFFERFGSAVLLTLIDAGAQAGANAAGPEGQAVVFSSGRDFSPAAEIALQSSVAIPPTVHVAAGKRLFVFVNRDLDFSGVEAWSAEAAR